MSARDDVVAAAETLRVQLPLQKKLWPEETWRQLQAELLDWLGAFERCRHEEDWLAAWSWLMEIATRHDLLELVESALLFAPEIPDVADPSTGPDRTKSLDPTWLEDLRSASRSVGELVVRLRHILAPMPGARAAPIEAYPEARVEGEVFEQRAFRLEVLVRAEPTTGANYKATFPRTGSDSVDLDVVLALPRDGSITCHSPLEHPLRVPGGHDSNRLSFELFAVRPGRHRIGVRFLQGGMTRAELTVPVLVLAAHEQLSQGLESTSVSARLQVGSGRTPPGLVLVIEPRGRSNGRIFLRMTLTDAAARRRVDALTEIAEDAQLQLVSLCQRIREELALRQREARENRLRGIGAELAARLLPQTIREELASEQHPEGRSLHIESRDEWLPWELFHAGPPGQGRFLGDWFAVTRWHGDAQFRSNLDGERAVLVTPRHSGLRVDSERLALERLTGAPMEELRTVHEVQERLHRNPTIGFLHFACHGTSALASRAFHTNSGTRDVVLPFSGAGAPLPPHPRGVLLLEDQEHLQTSDVLRDHQRGPLSLEGALVFLNACQSGLPGVSPWGHESWVDTFFHAGAAALLAPSWTISDECAGKFAQVLYERLAAGETLAKAAWWARKQILEPGSADRLGYAVYAFPDAHRSRAPTPNGGAHP
ncbi:CHAT domain-containing protein [Archangium violaceum]|uniref:CHAT domain-containing protein n=1 Tax=Archangium violaceum TaxID=83451 RepID=UPI002B2C8480|nr:CHAT domain-containing protein [Archangium gephyra]